ISSLESVASHLSICESCASSVDSTTDTDVLVLALRHNMRNQPPVARQQRLDEDLLNCNSRAAAERQKPHVPHRLGQYEILERVGCGAMGIVYRAHQFGLNRIVALKAARPGLLWSHEAASRFRTECAAVARLRHPNIVQIYDYAEEDGVPYFSM